MTKVYIVSFVGPSFTSDCRKWIVNILELGTFKKLAYWRDMMVAGNKYSPKKVVGYIA